MTARSVDTIADGEILLSEDRPAGRGLVRILTLNRPAKRNALNTALLEELRDALQRAHGDATVQAVVLAGTGVGFCAGGDRAEFRDASSPRAGMVGRAQLIGEVQSLLPRLSVPVICAAHGAALGAGAALALAGDMTIAGSDLSLGYPEIQDGVVPAVVMPSAAHLFGRKLAFELLSTGRRLTALEALQHGVVNRVVDPEALLSSATEVAAQWATVDPQALRHTKRLFSRVVELSVDAGVQAGVDVTAATWSPRR